jgi:hypothetical protein
MGLVADIGVIVIDEARDAALATEIVVVKSIIRNVRVSPKISPDLIVSPLAIVPRFHVTVEPETVPAGVELT